MKNMSRRKRKILKLLSDEITCLYCGAEDDRRARFIATAEMREKKAEDLAGIRELLRKKM